VGHHWLGLDNNNSGTLGSEGCGELLGELFARVRVHCPASEAGCDGGDVEAGQIHAGYTGGFLQQCEGLEVRITTKTIGRSC
jgi:hypothetical protein